VVELRLAGGGGFGPAEEREDARIREDLRLGYVTPEGASRDYGFEAEEVSLAGAGETP
jgi:N-methylhydantoinase B/oxoprolinase/acetone carboxylase alpha subunit